MPRSLGDPWYKDLWYRLKCRFWHRYNTVSPRTLPKDTWTDRSDFMPHMMFEVLRDFLEKECGPDCIIEWSRTSMIDGEERLVIDVLRELDAWWHNDYLVNYKQIYRDWHDFVSEVSSDKFGLEISNEEDKSIADDLFQEAREEEQRYDSELNRNLKILVDLIPFMWT